MTQDTRVYRHIQVASDGSHFFAVRGMRSDAYRVSANDQGRRNVERWPRPFGLRRKSGHTSFPPSTVGPPQPSGSASSPPHGRRPVRGGPGSGRIFSSNDGRPYMSIHPSPLKPDPLFLFLFLFHGPLGVGEDLVGDQLRNDVVVVHLHAVAAFALRHATSAACRR